MKSRWTASISLPRSRVLVAEVAGDKDLRHFSIARAWALWSAHVHITGAQVGGPSNPGTLDYRRMDDGRQNLCPSEYYPALSQYFFKYLHAIINASAWISSARSTCRPHLLQISYPEIRGLLHVIAAPFCALPA